MVHEPVDLPVDEQRCAICHLPFRAFFNNASCDVIEVKVKAHVRRYHQKHYQKTCQCPETPNITVAPPPPGLINKRKPGVSVWVELLLNKYACGIPINRQLESYKTQGLDLSPATISFGQEAIIPFFEPVAEAIRELVAKSEQCRADETRWIVWGHEKTGSHKHWLWVFLCDLRFISVSPTLVQLSYRNPSLVTGLVRWYVTDTRPTRSSRMVRSLSF